MRPKLLIFASGGKNPTDGGSGFAKLVMASRNGVLEADIVAVVSNNERGGVYSRALNLGVKCIYSPKPRTTDDYRRIIETTNADFVALSGWLGQISGHDPRKTFNIHPAYNLEKFGGTGFHGHHVHEAVMAAYRNGEVTFSGVTMHFATARYDDPSAVFFKRKVPILEDDTPETLKERVNAVEHQWQAIITNRVVLGMITWNGRDSASIDGADIEV